MLVQLAKTNVIENGVNVTVNGFTFAPADRLRTRSGALTAPKASFTEKGIGIFDLTSTWDKVANADYYEVEFEGMLYSTIRDTKFTFDGLKPETTYSFKIRSVNKDGHSDWNTVSATTLSNPLELAVRDIKAQTTCENQPGNDINKLFDFDEKSMWHSKWGKGEAIPFEHDHRPPFGQQARSSRIPPA